MSIQQKKPIILVGFMGVGKTTIGKMLAQELGWTFIDTDQQIEEQQGMKIKEIFQQYGEEHFRKIERETVTALCQQQKEVILSLGGGAFIQEEVREVCLRQGTAIYLALSWEEWLQRMEYLIADRPILQTRSLEEIEQLFTMRTAIYAQCPMIMNTDGLTAEQVTERIIQQLSI